MDEKEKARQIDLRNLPRKNNLINWKESIGCKVPFQYDDIKGEVEIIGYNAPKLTIKYKNKEFQINHSNFLKVKFCFLLNKKTRNFSFKKGQTIKDDFRNLTIIESKYIKNNKKNKRGYRYHCNKCGYEGEVVEDRLLKGGGCIACANMIVAKEINDIATTSPETIKYFVNIEDVYTHTKGSSEVVLMKCPDCGFEKKMKIRDLYGYKFSCNKCGDKVSYPEKFIMNLLSQLKINYIPQLSKSTFKWCDKYRYDFYLPNYNIIIETHGIQHYEETKGYFAKNLNEQNKIDNIKKEIALNNSINKYIELDCRYSNLSYIKESILNSELNLLFDLSKIDWIECEKYCMSNLVKIACDYKRINPNMTTVEIGNIMNLHSSTISKYLKKGTEIGWCEYNSKEESKKATKNAINSTKKYIEIFKDNVSLGIFKGITELGRQSEKLFGIRLSNQGISSACMGKFKQYKGYVFKYITKEEYEKRIKDILI